MIEPQIFRRAFLLFLLAASGAAAAESASRPLTMVIIGDSTVCAYPLQQPDRGWGMFIEERFQPGAVRVTNLAASGRSTKTFIKEGRWQKALAEKPDVILIQFGHNDSHAPERPESTDAATTYKEFLRRYVDESRGIGATPVLVTPMVRRTFGPGGELADILQPYAEAMKAVAAEKQAPVIDLHASSRHLVLQLGPAKAAEMANKKGDGTHFNEQGARAMADLVIRELPAAVPQLKPLLRPVASQAPAQEAVRLWPDGQRPGNGAREPEAERPARGDGFHRITNVSDPTLTVFPAGRSPAPAMIICPGGGYGYVVIDKEGTEIAAWLNTNGITGLVLKYRNPNNRDGALQDLQRALSLVRSRAAEWNIDPKRLGVIGFSAGGHLAARASTRFGERSYPAVDAIDQQSCRPDFAVLVYPAYLDGKDGHVSPDLDLKADIPPTLILHSDDDKSFVPGSRLYNDTLDGTKIPHLFKCYPSGGHGYGLHCERDARAWPADALAWLKQLGVP